MKNTMKSKANNGTNLKRAFTLIELLVVIAIIALLSSVVLNSLAGARMKANDTKIAEDLRQFRIAAELYFNDNHTYPPTAMNYKDVNIAIQDRQQNKQDGWANKLSFFIKTAEAATTHTTPLCKNFDNVANSLVSGKYLASVPVHPYDNDTAGVCYKAVAASNTFSAYAALTTQVSVSGTSYNKRAGFILGDTSSSGLNNLVVSTTQMDSLERTYPMDSVGGTPSTLASSVDAISGITGGAPSALSGVVGIVYSVTNSCPSGQEYGPVCGGYDIPAKACQAPFTGTRIASASCYNGVPDPYSDHCTKVPLVSSLWGASIANAFIGGLPTCALGYTPSPCGHSACDLSPDSHGI